MDEEALKDFFTSLKLSLRNASLYFEKHPAFIKSVREVKEKIDTLLDEMSPLKISFTSKSLLVEEKFFEDEKIYKELAQIFHLHKIKNIEIRKGLTIEELITFLTKAYLSPENIIKEGGLSQILKNEKITHLTVEELDYSQLLMDKGEEIKEIWPYLLQEAVEQEDIKKIIKFADNFERFLKDYRAEDLIENKDLKVNINKFFAYLKDKEKDKFRNCSKDLLKSIIRSKHISREIESDETRALFKDLSNDDLASTLWDEILTDDSFNPLSFQIFSSLTAKRSQESLTHSIDGKFRRDSLISHSPKVRKKIKELLSDTSTTIISDVYRKTLASLLKDISFEEALTFDHNLLQKNYRFILLNLLDEEKKKKRMTTLLEEISGEWETIVTERDTEYLKSLLEVLERKKSDISSDPVLMKMNRQILYFVAENPVLEGDVSSDFQDVANYLKGSFLGIKAYLDKIFKETKVGPVVLQLFFQFYPDSFLRFKKKLREKSSDIDFLERIIKSLGKVDTPQSLESLKSIFSFGNESIRIKALKTMKQLSVYDEDFLFVLLKKRGVSLKKEAIELLVRDDNTKKKAIDELFSIASPFGIKNRVILENIRIVQEMDLEEARDYLVTLSERKIFWNKKPRGEALKVLKKWDGRTD